MSLSLVSSRPAVRLSGEERERLRTVAAQVASAAALLRRQGRTRLEADDLHAIGVQAVWEGLPAFDPQRSAFARWAFATALNAMCDASRAHLRDTLFEKGLRRGARGYVQLDERPAESDFHNDTPETDLRRLRHRNAATAAAAVIRAHAEQEAATGQAEQARIAEDTARILREEKARLSDEQRTHLTLRFWDEAAMEEIAQRLGVSIRTLHRRHVEVCDLLRARLAARGVTGIPEGLTDAADALDAREQTTGAPPAGVAARPPRKNEDGSA